VRILYLGSRAGTSLQRAKALQRLNHEVLLVDPLDKYNCFDWLGRWLHHTGGLGSGLLVDRHIIQTAMAVRPDLILVNQGELVGPPLLQRLRTLDVPIVNYTNDNPFRGRDGGRFRKYLKALPYYDLVVVPREEDVPLALKAGARNVMRVWFSADEDSHRPRTLSQEVQGRYRSEVAFVGTWMPERGEFIAELIALGVPLSVWGDRWQRAPQWRTIAPLWRGPGLFDDEGYAAVLQTAKVCLGLLSRGNHDLHTTRSVEIPALGGLLCAERTAEHLALYDEGAEAIFWDDVVECAHRCRQMLADECGRREIAQRGQQRARRNNHFNEPTLRAILERAMTTWVAPESVLVQKSNVERRPTAC
jgi:spore maturation protein CgeB